MVTKTQHLMPLVYRCSRAAFSKCDKCSSGSVVPSYSAMAGVRQFMGSLSAITPSIKGMPVRSSADLSPGIERPTVPFGDAPIGLAIEGVHLPLGRSEDSSTGGVSGETMILGMFVPRSMDLGVAVVADPKRGVNETVPIDTSGNAQIRWVDPNSLGHENDTSPIVGTYKKYVSTPTPNPLQSPHDLKPANFINVLILCFSLSRAVVRCNRRYEHGVPRQQQCRSISIIQRQYELEEAAEKPPVLKIRRLRGLTEYQDEESATGVVHPKNEPADQCLKRRELTDDPDQKMLAAEASTQLKPAPFPTFGPLYCSRNALFLQAKKHALEHTFSCNQTEESGSVAKEACMMSMRKILMETRDSYAEKLATTDPELRDMMIMDGCVFLQVALATVGGSQVLGYAADHVFFGKKNIKKWSNAMFIVGNQIPVVVLQELMMKQGYFQNVIRKGTWHQPSSWAKRILYDLLVLPSLQTGGARGAFCDFFCCRRRRYARIRGKSAASSENLPVDVLQGLRGLVLGPLSGQEEYETNEPIDLEAYGIANGKRISLKATKLRQKGITCKPLRDGMGSRGIYFKENFSGAHLYLPVVTVEDDIEMILEHLKSYETNLPSHQREFCAYIGFMSDILRTPKDVQLLAKQGVILGTRGHTEKLPGILRRMDCNDTTEHLQRVKLQVNDYQGPEWHAYLKNLLSLVVLLTVVQTVYAALSYHLPNSKS
ncbi:UNVERIFIED_CONTAM: hypothetical protein Scaly_2721000 [Sesamum calycinum]|uniref:Uncharacterized protein n=1 Tax=Sesamum calycinum TaxID=2727403 RepID=A0AAW2J453_9LAMI